MNTDRHGLKGTARRAASTIPSAVLSEPNLTKTKKAAWLYPISESAGWHFSLRSGKRLDVSAKNFEKLVRDKSLTTGDRTWPLATNFKNVNEDDDLFVYTGDHDRGIIGYGSVKSVDRKKRAIVLSFDRTKCLQLLRKPISALVIRQWLWPRAAVADLTPHLSELKSFLPWTESRQTTFQNILAKSNQIAGAGFGNAEQNKKVEKAAIHVVTKDYRKQGWDVVSVEQQRLGFDLLCSKGSQTETVEVKGISSGNFVAFIITVGERRAAKQANFVLKVVCNALSKQPIIKTWTGQEMEKKFSFAEINYIASLKN